MTFRTQLCATKPRCGKLSNAVSHILPTEHTELEHFFWRKLRLKLWIEVFSDWFGAEVNIVRLHQIVNFYAPVLHRYISATKSDKMHKRWPSYFWGCCILNAPMPKADPFATDIVEAFRKAK